MTETWRCGTCVKEGTDIMSHIVDVGVNFQGKWRFVVRWRDDSLENATVMRQSEMENY